VLMYMRVNMHKHTYVSYTHAHTHILHAVFLVLGCYSDFISSHYCLGRSCFSFFCRHAPFSLYGPPMTERREVAVLGWVTGYQSIKN